MTERRLFGRMASPGLASGKVSVLEPEVMSLRAAGTPVEEARALREAIAASLVEVKAMAERADGDAAELLAFQVEMLADDELAGSSLAAIRGGAGAHAAWSAAMAAEVEGYQTSEDEYFAARAADLQDISDRVLRHLGPGKPDGAPTGATVPAGAVVVAVDLPLSRFLSIDWAGLGGAIVLTQGSPSGHVAMLARARGVPMVVGVGGQPAAFAGQEALVDADAGEVVLDPGEAACAAFLGKRRKRAADTDGLSTWQDRQAVTADGTRIALHVNISALSELDQLDPRFCDGIGLARTELLFAELADEETQYLAYRQLAVWAGERSATIRTLDVGADKPLPGVAMEPESNPFLGLRGIRLSLRHPALFRTQLRALARAAVHGALRIMLPMVTIPEELETARRILEEVLAELRGAGVAAARPALGMMVEVPAAAIAIDRFDAAFFSIGSNDLVQYVTAAGRDIGTVAELADPLNPAVLRLVATVAEHGQRSGRDVSLCGDAAADPLVVPHLLHAGLRSLSVAPNALARAKRAIAGVDLRQRPV
jgi:phosphotransferase system enzyme I (PtsI)